MTRSVLLCVATCLSGAWGCAHSVTIDSVPTGAAVVMDGKRVGTTPYQLDDVSGSAGVVVVEVQNDQRAQRFAIERDEFNIEAVLAGVGVGGGMVVGGFGLLAIGVVAVTLSPALGFPLGVVVALAGFAGYLLGIVAFSYSPLAPVIAAARFARQGPDRVVVHLNKPAEAKDTVTSEPADQVVPLLGRTPLGPSPAGGSAPVPADAKADPPFVY